MSILLMFLQKAGVAKWIDHVPTPLVTEGAAPIFGPIKSWSRCYRPNTVFGDPLMGGLGNSTRIPWPGVRIYQQSTSWYNPPASQENPLKKTREIHVNQQLPWIAGDVPPKLLGADLPKWVVVSVQAPNHHQPSALNLFLNTLASRPSLQLAPGSWMSFNTKNSTKPGVDGLIVSCFSWYLALARKKMPILWIPGLPYLGRCRKPWELDMKAPAVRPSNIDSESPGYNS